MSGQIFRKEFPLKKLFEFLETWCEKNNNYYRVTKNGYKSAQYKNMLQGFCDSVKEYYYKSKQYYATRKLSYKSLVTIIRQLCKYHHIPFTSSIKYDKSSYEISYSIFFDSVLSKAT